MDEKIGGQDNTSTVEKVSEKKEVSLYKKLGVIFGLVIILFGTLFFFNKPVPKENKGIFEDNLTPAERKVRVLDRVTSAPKEPLDDKEARYIFNYLSSAEGKTIQLSEDEKMKLINSLNQ